jgi:hypothetical protein
MLREIKSNSVIWERHTTQEGEFTNAYKIFVGKP